MRDVVIIELNKIYRSLAIIKRAMQSVHFDEQFNTIAVIVCETVGITFDDLVSDKRMADIVNARILLTGIASEKGYYLQDMGRFFNQADHTTASYYRRKHLGYLDVDDAYKQQYSIIINKLKDHEQTTTNH